MHFGVGSVNSVEKFAVAHDFWAHADEGRSPEPKSVWTGCTAVAPEQVSDDAGHRLCGIGRHWQMEVRINSKGAVIIDGMEKFENDSMNSLRTTGGLGQVTQSLCRAMKRRTRRRFEPLTNEPIEIFPDRTAQEGSPLTSALSLEFQDQMEMAELKNPVVVLGQVLHPRQVVDDNRADSTSYRGWQSGKNSFPFARSFSAREQDGIQKEGDVFGRRLHGGEIENPRFVSKIKPQTVGHQDQRAARQSVRIRSGCEPAQRLAESISETRQGKLRPPLSQVAERTAFEENLFQDPISHTDGRAAALAGADRPGPQAAGALASPVSETTNFGSTTGRFHMLSFHTCELFRFGYYFETMNSLIP